MNKELSQELKDKLEANRMFVSKKVDRNNNIVKMRDSGMTFTQIGYEVGVTRERAHQIYHNTKKNENN